MSYSKSKEKIPNNSLFFWNDTRAIQSINEHYFIENGEKIAVYIDSIKHQLEILKSLYNQYLDNLSFRDNLKIDAQVEEELKDIYSNGSCVMSLLKKINPDSLFDQTELSKEKLSLYQSQHEEYCLQFKSLWVALYDLKQENKSQKLAFVKVYMQANYPNAKEGDITMLSERMVETNCLEGFAFNKYATAVEALNYVTLRYKEIRKLEASVDEVHQLFVDMWALTQQQGYTIEKIRENIQTAKEDIKSSRDDFKDSYQSKKKHWYS